MRKTWQLAASAGACGLLAIATLVHAGLAATGTPIQITFRDATGDQIGSDGKGAYVTQGAVDAEFDASGNLHLDTDLQARKGGRTLSLAFEDPVSSSSQGPFTGPKQVVAFMSTSGVFDNGNNVIGLLQMTPGHGGTANLNVNIAGWFIRFNPDAYPQSTQVSVTRNDQQHWTIEPLATGQAGAIKLSNNGKTQTDEGSSTCPLR